MSGSGYRGQNDTFENHVQSRPKEYRSGDETSQVTAQNRTAISASRQEVAGISGYRLPPVQCSFIRSWLFLAPTWMQRDHDAWNQRGFLEKKFDENIVRDRRHIEALQDAGWRVMVVWECSLKGKGADPDKVARHVSEWLVSSEKHMVIPELVPLFGQADG